MDAAVASTQLARRLPAYMAPCWFELLDQLPLGATGKFDRQSLIQSLGDDSPAWTGLCCHRPGPRWGAGSPVEEPAAPGRPAAPRLHRGSSGGRRWPSAFWCRATARRSSAGPSFTATRPICGPPELARTIRPSPRSPATLPTSSDGTGDIGDLPRADVPLSLARLGTARARDFHAATSTRSLRACASSIMASGSPATRTLADGAPPVRGARQPPVGPSSRSARDGTRSSPCALRALRATAARWSPPRHMLFETPPEESLDIDTNDGPGHRAAGGSNRGTWSSGSGQPPASAPGHIYHCLQLADELADQRAHFLLRDCDSFVDDLMAEHGYAHRTETDLVREDSTHSPRAAQPSIVNDVLDTTEQEILMRAHRRVPRGERRGSGPGARVADWSRERPLPARQRRRRTSSVTGADYATLRAEFIHLPPKQIRQRCPSASS